MGRRIGGKSYEPMLASPAGDLPPLDNWTLEPKWDGYRVIAVASASATALWSRNGIDKADQFPEVRDALCTLAASTGPVVLDGELVSIDSTGKPLRFQALQSRAERAPRDARTAFVAFDLLAIGERSITAEAWSVRRDVLESAVKKSSRAIVRRGDSFRCGTAGARKMLDAAVSEGWEGIMVKRTDSPYLPGQRSPLWRKVKLEHEQEFVIGGFTRPTNDVDREYFSALLVGYYSGAELKYAGKVGTGYTRATLKSLGERMEELARDSSPFSDAPSLRDDTVWIAPRLVAQVRYNEMTSAGILRQPAFLGLRDDKRARDVTLEQETSRRAVFDTLRCGK